MSKAGFGEHLKREREMRGVSLDEICAATRISTRFLEALEREEWERLPGGIFNRGFVRAVARYLGLDEEGFVAEYAMALSEDAPAPEWTAQPTPSLRITEWLPWIGAGVLLVVLAGVGWFAWRRHVLHRAQPAAAGPAAPRGTSAAQPGAQSAATFPDRALQLKVEAGKPTTLTVSVDGSTAFAGPMTPGQSHTFSAQSIFTVAAQDSGALLLSLNGKTLAPIGPAGHPGRVMLTQRDVPSGAGGTD